jgi:hypothetical protein
MERSAEGLENEKREEEKGRGEWGIVQYIFISDTDMLQHSGDQIIFST